ncbi:MAG: tetratricopeptide repeat protein [Candidatus Omnitrophica bacterium]|nr:tetratricopeptide repeat protein [Candidatus Omnitrophota bacterium]
MKISRKIFVFSLVIFFVFIALELIARVKLETIPIYEDSPQFKHSYLSFRNFVSSRSIPDTKMPGTKRVFIVGGSVAAGFPEQVLRTSLNILTDCGKFEVFNLGQGAYDSYRVYVVMKNIILKQPDLIIVFSGNNEYYDPVKINITAYYLNMFFRKSYIYSMLQDRFTKKIALKRRSLQERLSGYEKNILNIINLAKKNKIPIMICTLPFNFKDIAPDCPRSGSDRFLENFIKSKYYLENNKIDLAIKNLTELLNSDPDNALGLYYLGFAYNRLGDYKKAKLYYLRAYDTPSNFWISARPSSNELLRLICKKHNTILIDIESKFMEIAEHGLVGKELMFDYCHWYLSEYSIVTELIIEAILSNASLFSALYGLDCKDVRFDCVKERLSDFRKQNNRRMPFEGHFSGIIYCLTTESGGYNFTGVSDRIIDMLKILYFIYPEKIEEIRFSRQNIRDYILNQEHMLNKPEADFLSDYKKNWPYVLYMVGEAFRQLNMTEQALAYFNDAIELKQDFYLAYLSKALVCDFLGDKEGVCENWERARDINNSVEIECYKELFKL